MCFRFNRLTCLVWFGMTQIDPKKDNNVNLHKHLVNCKSNANKNWRFVQNTSNLFAQNVDDIF